MISDNQIAQNLGNVLQKTDLPFLGRRYEGKVRDSYVQGDTRYLVACDRLSCFDVVVTSIPFKGQVLTGVADYWFKKSRDIITNHVIDLPDPNVMVVRNCEILPVEVVLRGYLTGSAWRDYQDGKAVSGVKLPPGLKASQKLPQVLITPSTKAERGQHDEPISEAEILARGIVPKAVWEEVREAALALFKLGQEEAARRGLILVDTKYEFGLLNGKLILADEIHTLDSSRYWVEETYQKHFEAGTSPEMLDKEPVRQWLLARGYKGEGAIPEFTADHRVGIARHYIDSAAKICGLELIPESGSVHERIERRLKAYAARAPRQA